MGIELLAEMWGGTVSDYGLSITDNTFWMAVYCFKPERPRAFRVAMNGILSLSLTAHRVAGDAGSLTRLWFYIDLTSIAAERVTKDGQVFWKVIAELWESMLEVVCLGLEVSEVTV